MKVGDYVQVKKGVLDPDYLKYDFSGFKGVVTDVMPADSPDDETIVSLDWDMETLKKLPKEFIGKSVEEGMFFSAMNLAEENLITLSEVNKDDKKERENLIIQLETDSEYMDKDDKLYASILGKKIQVNTENLLKYRDYLIKNIDDSLLLTGREDFPWEERYVFGFGSKKDYEELKKTNPSYRDTFKFLEILPADTHDRDLIVKVKRVSDRKKFEIGLSWLVCTEKDTDNYDLIDMFSSWSVNY